MEKESKLGILENAPPWWPNFKPPEFTEEDLCEIERYCAKIIENVTDEKAKMTPKERLKATLSMELPDRPFVYTHNLNIPVARALDCWSDSLKPGIDLYWYPKLCLKGHLAWAARFNSDMITPYPFTYGETEYGGSARTRISQFTAPAAVSPAIKTEEDWDRIHLPDINHDGFFPVYLWMVKKMKEFMKKHGVADVMPLYGMIEQEVGAMSGVPIIGMKSSLMAIRRNPALLHKCAKMTTQLCINLGKALLDAQVDILTTVSEPGIGGVEAYKQFDEYYLKVAKELQPLLWGFGFDMSSILEIQCQTGAMGTGWLGSHENPLEVQKSVATKYKKVYAAGFNPIELVNGPAENIQRIVKNIIKTCAGPGFLLFNGGTDYWSKPEYIDLYIKTAKEYGTEVYRSLNKP